MSRVLWQGVRPLSWTRVVPVRARRCIQIRATASEQHATPDGAHLPNSVESQDARFDVIGAPYSLLSVSLSASQNLFTRRGTLVGLSGKADNVVSTLSVLEPLRRAVVGVPFLYQKISSVSPVTALISVRSPITSFAVLHLNGSVDWMIAQRRALLAWTGHTISIRPTIDTSLSISHWGSSKVTGRGLLALVGNGQLYSVELKSGEQYIAHPSNVVAYTMNSNPPRPYRFKSTTLNFQAPDFKTLPAGFQNSRFIQDMSDSKTWKNTVRVFHALRTWFRMTVWGDRLFLQFDGPSTILVQSRGARINDIMTSRDVNEIASSPRGLTVDPAEQKKQQSKTEEHIRAIEDATKIPSAPTEPVDDVLQKTKVIRQGFATISKEGKVEFKKLGQES